MGYTPLTQIIPSCDKTEAFPANRILGHGRNGTRRVAFCNGVPCLHGNCTSKPQGGWVSGWCVGVGCGWSENRGSSRRRTGESILPRCVSVCVGRLYCTDSGTHPLRSVGPSCTDAADESPTPRVSEIVRFGLPGGHAMQKLSAHVILRRRRLEEGCLRSVLFFLLSLYPC